MAFLNVSLNLLSGNTFVKTTGEVKLLNNSLGKTEGILDNISDQEIIDIKIPIGVPLIYELDIAL